MRSDATAKKQQAASRKSNWNTSLESRHRARRRARNETLLPRVSVFRVQPWISVSPGDNPQAILGNLPFTIGSVTLPIPESVVPSNATGILVFAWTALSGKNPDPGTTTNTAFWHIASTSAGGVTNWFSLFIVGDPTGASITTNAQEFWLPMPADGTLTVTLHTNNLPSPTNKGEVEIHGYTTTPSADAP